MTTNRKTAALIAVILVLVGLISFFALSKAFSDPETYKTTIQVLDEKEKTVAKLSAVSIAAAAAIDLIPGDTGKSVSEALVNLGGFFIILFAAIYLEKILLTIGGFAAFKVLIPIGLFLIAGFLFLRKESLKALGMKLISVGLVLFLIVPASVWVSGKVDEVHGMSKQLAINEIGEETNLLEKETEEQTEQATEETSENEDSSEDSSESKIKNLFGKIKNGGSSAIGKVKEGSSTVFATAKEVPKKMNELLDNLIEEVAYFIVSICVIPVVVLILLAVFLKQILGFTGPGVSEYGALVRQLRRKIPEKKEVVE